ncbi:DUF1499 domain-containing protein [Parerythrobacter jejuensis]|uniref:DUF1499 domain-containing protein n=1 Tax=Parerythrobacter jejuensis TaxID=795812 RepID=A0A845ASG3_9SPHN|nr:DUF1499 domain-containing protein [Parerythrobacter jejuensis]MXP32419.1 DUF1499 domain-containing protein [Parerythrobacter jejuensis]
MTEHPWTRRISGLAFWLALAAVLVAFAGMTLARFDIVGKLQGFSMFLYMVPIAGIAALIAVVALIMNWRAGWPAVRKAVLGLIIGAGAFGAATVAMSAATEVPAIHDITTDLDTPPEFAELSIPADNMRGVDGVEDWKAQHREGYPDLDGITVDQTVEQVITRAAEIAEDKGWDVAASDAATGRFEAVSYASYIKFEDIVVLRAVPTEDGKTRVDMRSVSRVGVSDLGENAKRIEGFLAALQAG